MTRRNSMKTDSADSLNSRGAISIKDLISSNEVQARNGAAAASAANRAITSDNGVQSNVDAEPVKRKRGRPRITADPDAKVVKKKFEKKTYVDTPALRHKIAFLEAFIDAYDQTIKTSGRPRVHPLKDTLTRKKVATFPLEVQAKCQEYLEAKKLLPPTKPLGRPRKTVHSTNNEVQSAESKTSSAQASEFFLAPHNMAPTTSGNIYLNNPYSIPSDSGFFHGRHPSAEVNDEGFPMMNYNNNGYPVQQSSNKLDTKTDHGVQSVYTNEQVKVGPKKRGRPLKSALEETEKRGRGRPRKNIEKPLPMTTIPQSATEEVTESEKRNRGRIEGRLIKTTQAFAEKTQDQFAAAASDTLPNPTNNKLISICAIDSQMNMDTTTQEQQNTWRVAKKDTHVHVSKVYLQALLNPGLKDPIES